MAVASLTHAGQLEHCQPVDSQALAKLERYVKVKYKLPYLPVVAPSDIQIVNSSCYRRIRFSAPSDGSQGTSLTLYAAPDLRFLSRELLDSDQDPLEEEVARRGRILASLTGTSAPTLGPSGAAVTITVFSDFQCPYCRELATVIREEVHPSDPDVRIVFRQFPLAMHSWSKVAAKATTCFALQGNEFFWAAHDFIFQHQAEFHPNDFVDRVEDFMSTTHNGDLARFRECIHGDTAEERVKSDVAIANDNEVTATPTIFINSLRLDGSASAAQIRTLINQMKRQISASGS
jgi:protein-disulfide isomerase